MFNKNPPPTPPNPTPPPHTPPPPPPPIGKAPALSPTKPRNAPQIFTSTHTTTIATVSPLRMHNYRPAQVTAWGPPQLRSGGLIDTPPPPPPPSARRCRGSTRLLPPHQGGASGSTTSIVQRLSMPRKQELTHQMPSWRSRNLSTHGHRPCCDRSVQYRGDAPRMISMELREPSCIPSFIRATRRQFPRLPRLGHGVSSEETTLGDDDDIVFPNPSHGRFHVLKDASARITICEAPAPPPELHREFISSHTLRGTTPASITTEEGFALVVLPMRPILLSQGGGWTIQCATGLRCSLDFSCL